MPQNKNSNFSNEEAVVQRIEQIFSDEQLKKEPFLMRQMQNNPGGWIQLKAVVNRNKFNYIRAISKDVNAIATALEKNPNGLVQLSSDRQKIRRNPEMPIPQ